MSAPTLTPSVTRSVSRTNFSFAPDGRQATCLRSGDRERALELWSFRSLQADRRVLCGVPAVDPATQALPLCDGRVLLHPHPVGRPGGEHPVYLLDPKGGHVEVRELGGIPALGGYLLPGPSTRQLGVVVSRDDPDNCTIWRVTADPADVTPVLRLPGVASGGVWLDAEAGLLGLNLTEPGRGTAAVLTDLTHGTWSPFFSVYEASDDRIAGYSPASRLLVVSTTARGESRLGLVRLGTRDALQFPVALHGDGSPRHFLTFDETGERLLLHEQAGATSRLLSYTVAEDRLTTLATPPGMIQPQASWSNGVIRAPFSTPTTPLTVLSVAADGERRCAVATPDTPASSVADADLVKLEGPAGPVEAIAYGGPQWQSSQHLVLALHGGPLASWRLEFTPLFQDLAAAGIAVLAPNYRGSCGYGSQHMRAVLGAWGGPDLWDVTHIARRLARERAERGLAAPVVYGVSYGAFLTLLAAAVAPRLWSAAVAVAPFLSGRRLHDTSPPWVAQRLERLGALETVTDALGPRDALLRCAEITAPLLVVHGTDDETIPVSQSRALRRRLRQLGRDEATDFCYHELPGDHNDLTQNQPAALRELIVRFCRTGAPGDPRRPLADSGRRLAGHPGTGVDSGSPRSTVRPTAQRHNRGGIR